MPDKPIDVVAEAQVLTSDEVAKVAATVESNYPLRLYLSRFGIDLPALCTTVRRLETELRKWEDNHDQLCLQREELYRDVHAENKKLRDQLVAAVQERAALREQLKTEQSDHALTIATFRRQEKIWEQKHNEFITNAINLCREKASHWSGFERRAANELARLLETL